MGKSLWKKEEMNGVRKFGILMILSKKVKIKFGDIFYIVY